MQSLFPLRGADIVEMGVAAGPEVGDLLAQVERWWIDGDFAATQSQCLAEVERIVSAAAN
jgi:poly(A) polymerase